MHSGRRKIKMVSIGCLCFLLFVTQNAIGSSPFGSFDTPVSGLTVAGTVPVTGWALDDVEVSMVIIFNEDDTGLEYIAQARFVEGARPDVAAVYPQYPNSHKAGWSLSLPTNLLPYGGNTSYNLHAVAVDNEGNYTLLGIHTIHCDNANAVKPFGIFDTPAHGEVVSGVSYVNRGWALTPQPNYIPTDGSTIRVYIDGINAGHPAYNIYRADIASSLWGYANSNGAGGTFDIDTTLYTDGIHTIQWVVTDSAGNTDSIGSRYILIQNGPAVTPPVVTTEPVTDFTTGTASAGGNVTSDGNAAVTARGVCWSTSPHPLTLNDSTDDGAGTGAFTSSLSGLSSNTTYYVRAYATNSKGTSYGDEVELDTSEPEVIPTLNEWGMMVMTILLMAFSFRMMRRKQRTA